jgi:ABC-2 type transport system permease protein
MLAVARVEILILIHDRPTISLILLVPAIQIVLFGYAVNLNPKNISIAIAGDSGDLMRQVHRTIEETGYFTILGDGLKRGEAERMVIEGKALVGLEFPRNNSDGDAFSEELKVVADATDLRRSVRRCLRWRTPIGSMSLSLTRLVGFLPLMSNGFTIQKAGRLGP